MTSKELVLAFLHSNGLCIIFAAITASVIKLFMNNALSDLMIYSGVVIVWPMLERFFHRFLMHEWTFLPLHFTHTRHHVMPTKENGLPDAWIIVSYYVLSIVFFATGANRLQTAFVAVMWMLVAYEFNHFSCHSNYQPKTYWGWAIRLNHLKHHNHDQTKHHAMLFPMRK